jgi:hypothetical protein
MLRRIVDFDPEFDEDLVEEDGKFWVARRKVFVTVR